MPFSSVAFPLAFLPLTLVGCLLAGRCGQFGIKLWLIVASVLFYGLNAPRQFPILLVFLAVNIALSRMLSAGSRTRVIAACGVGVNLAVLCWFRYLTPALWPETPLLPGISFLVFTQIGLLLWLAADSTERVSLLDQTLFSLFFPVILSGPILNPHEMLPGFRRGLGLTEERLAVGLGFFCIGLVKKTALADPLSGIVASGFTDPSASGALGAWLAALGWYLQLYFDFSGYTDMAIGLGWMVGIRLPDNFEQPYRAGSVIQYWQRWHMSLTRFLMTNVYAPLTMAVLRRRRRFGLPINEAAQRSPTGFAVMIGAPIVGTMLLAGIWHGPQVTYGLFGLLHAGFLLINHAWRLARRPALSPVLAICLTQAAVLTGAVIFRSATPGEAGSAFAAMAGLHGPGTLDWRAVRTILRLGLMLGLVWFAPTTRQFMLEGLPLSWPALSRPSASFAVETPPVVDSGDTPGHDRGGFGQRRSGPRWQPSPAMAFAMGGLAALGLLACSGTQSFVYFSF